MEFREYASQEVSTLIDRLVSDAQERAEALLDGKQREHDAALTSVRGQFETQAGALESRARELEGKVREADQEKARLAAVAEETRAKLAALHDNLEEHRAGREAQALEIELQASELEERTRELELRGRQLEARGLELEARGVEKEQLEGVVEETHAQLAIVRAEVEQQRTELEQQRFELEQHRSELEQYRAELEQRRLELEQQQAEAELHRRDADQQRSLAAAGAAAELELVDARAALEAAQADAERLTRQFESALEELRAEHLSTLQQQAVARSVLPLDELLSVFESLASASTPSAILTTVVSGLGREFSRVALFRVRGARLECVSHVGFEFEGDVAKVVIPTSLDCLMTRAVASRKTHTFVTGTSDEPCAVPFGGTPACAVALPLISGDAPVAVVYADDSDQLEFGSVPAELLVKFAELVWQHAILVLQRASAAQKTLAVAPVQNFERLA